MKMKTALYLTFLLGLRAAFGADADTPASPTLPYQAKVVDANGQPLPGVVVERYEDPEWLTGGGTDPRLAERATTDGQGVVKFTPTHRVAFTLVASKPGLSIAWAVLYPQLGFGPSSSELALTAPRPVSGVVQDAGGKPVADAEVWVSAAYRQGKRAAFAQNRSPLSGALGRQLLTTRTGADGKFRLDRVPEDTTLALAAAAPGLALEQDSQEFADLSYQAGQSNVILTLKPAGAIEGRVVQEESGTPVAGALIQSVGMGSANYLRPAAPTGPEGRFQLVDVAPGEYQLRALIGTNAFPDWVSDIVAVTVESGATNREVKITASHGGVLEVTVRDAQGKPIKDAGVTVASPGGRSAQTTDQGVARFRLAPGPYTVLGSKEGLSGQQIQAVCERDQTNRVEVSLESAPRFAGTVLDPQGKPAPGIAVMLFPFQQGQEMTDARGQFSLTPNVNPYGGANMQRIVIARDLDRNLAAALEVEEDTTNASVRLEPGLTLAGRVTGADGKAITNAELNLMFHTERFGTQLGAPVGVDTEGRFEIKGLPTGRWYGVTASAKGYGAESRNVDAAEATTGRVEIEKFQLPVADRRLAGVVVDENEKPVAGAMIYANGEGQPNLNGRSDAKGRFAFDKVCAGPVNISANLPRGNAYGNARAEGGDTNITVQLGVQQNFGPMAAASGKSKLAGHVVDPEGKPAPKITVSLFPYSQVEKQTDAEGRFTLTADPNQYGGMQDVQRIVIARDLARNLAATLDVEEDTTNAPLKLEPGLTLAGRITDAKGNGIPKAEVHLMLLTERMGNSLGQPTRADAEGRFEVKGLPPGLRYSLNVMAKGYGNDNRGVEPGDATTRRIDLDPFKLALADQRIAGVVVDDDDKPVRGASVHTYGNGQPNVNSQTDAKGRFAFDHVCAGPININANSPRGNAYGSTVAEGGDTNITVRLGVNEGMVGMGRARTKIVGIVQDPDGKPATKVAVSLFPFSQSEKRTDAEGRFTLTGDANQFGGMQEVQRVVIARDLARNLATAFDLDADATNATLKLEPGLSLAGRVTDSKGNGIPQAEVHLMFMTERRGSSLGQPTRADAEGRFEIKGLPPGRRYSVNVVAKGYGTENRQVEATDPTTRRIDLDPFQLAVADQKIAGVVLDDDDKPVKGAMIYTYGNGQPNVNGQTDTKGRFAFDHVCSGPINVNANSPRGNAYGSTVADGGDTNITVRLGVNEHMGGMASSKITGTILAPDGKPAPKVLVSLFPDPQGEKATDAEGRFKLIWDPNRFGGPQTPQRVVLARDLTHNLAAALDLEEGATNAEIKLEPAWTLAGRAVDPNGAAIPGAQAQPMLKTDRMTSGFGSPTRANAEGRFEIKGLPNGRGFSVRISAPGFGQDTPNVDPPEGDAHRVELDPTQLLVADQSVAGVVVDADDKPVAGAWVNGSGNKQPYVNGQTDSKGRFVFKQVCAGPLRLYANNQRGLFGNANVEGGDTNVTLRIAAARAGGGRTPPPPVASLEGKPLPDLTALGLAGGDVPAKRPLLALLIDAEQRPSRRLLKRMTELADTYKQKGLAVIVLQAGAMEGAALEAWKQENAIPFPVGLFKGNREKARAAWGAAALPWLILADADHKVTAEGFAIGELDEKLESMKK